VYILRFLFVTSGNNFRSKNIQILGTYRDVTFPQNDGNIIIYLLYSYELLKLYHPRLMKIISENFIKIVS